MATYTIRAVSKQVRDYNGQYGPMKSYKIALDGAGADPQEAIELSQKPDTAAPSVGQILEGTIDRSGQFGPKFKKDFAAGKTFGGSKKDEEGIKAQWAIGQAMTYCTNRLKATEHIDLTVVEALAKDLFAMTDRVKSNTDSTQAVTELFGEGEVQEEDPFEGMVLA